jgi:IS5 family transposase
MNKPTQSTFAPAGFEAFRKVTRREKFLAEMDRVVPWAELVALVKPAYAKGTSGPGRPPIPLERMLRIYFLQHWFNLSDPAVEEALYESVSMRTFAGIDLGRESAPDETTVCKFRHLLEEHGLGKRIFEAVGAHLQRQGLKVSSGTIVDATIIAAPSSTKNADGERDPEMHQTRKGKDWHFGMKAHVGVDKKTKLIHSVVATPANVADGNVVGDLLHGGETHVWGDAAYSGRTERIRAKAPKAKDFTQRRGRGYRYLSEYDRWINRARSRVRARVEHSIGVIKRVFGFAKVRYRGIAKNANRLFVTCALANLFIARHRLRRVQGA